MSWAAAVWEAIAANPLYVTELLRAGGSRTCCSPGLIGLVAGSVVRELRGGCWLGCVGLDPRALGVAQALAVHGDGSELRHATAIVGLHV